MKKETRRLAITRKVFAKADIQRIAQVFLDEYRSIRQGEQGSEHHCSLIFQMSCADGTSYESESTELFQDGGPADIKKTKSIQMTLHDYTLDRSLDLSLEAGNYRSGTLVVRGCETAWVNGAFMALKDVIDSVRPQQDWVLRHRSLSLHLTALGVGSLAYLVLDWLVYRHMQPIQNPSGIWKAMRDFMSANPWFTYLYLWFCRWLMGMGFGALPVHRWLLELWPEVEFDFGPEHLNLHKVRRGRLAVVLSVVAIPLALEIVGDILNALRGELF